MRAAAGAGCNRMESPAETRRDVSEAQREADKQVADATDTAAEQGRNVAMARIEGE